ncbi:hypothetical protein [Planktothrix sp. FACHB-1365]|uniref:hypothetical protein n=1 Tax=Planktothrix sp. FACHB-1365 TaxID=2692855 RepID=UPI00168810AD|nr:hypothetical protein [Planktothrix sp. FACHB-1365]MBD2483850.1 hypothetical protein [Planktothrix sp. FACHB-1365]
MNLQELKNAAYQFPVHERLLLVESIIHSLSQELRPRPDVLDGITERLRGILKPDNAELTDEDVERLKTESIGKKAIFNFRSR